MSEPHVLSFGLEIVLDARDFERPANFWLASIEPPAGVVIDPLKRPFVVFDPRAGQGPGIGGFKADSELGVAMGAGHACYFVGFTPDPMPHQTVNDVMSAHGRFLEAVITQHPEAEGKPCVIGNCQAGWAVMMLAAVRPELFGPIIVAGTPLSFWAGLDGQNPSRYSGGLSGGSWLTALASDIGGWQRRNWLPMIVSGLICAILTRRFCASVPRAITSPRRRRRWVGFATCTGRTRRFLPPARLLSTPFTKALVILVSSCPAALLARSTRSSHRISI